MAERSELSLFRCAAGLTALEVVRLLKPHFPLIDKTVISKAEHGDLYGVELNPKAWKILKEAYPVACNKAKNKAQKRKADRHKKTRRLSVRLSEERFLELQQQMQAEGLTAQEFLERVLGRIATAPFWEPRNDRGSDGGADGSGVPSGHALRITVHNAPGWQHHGPLVIAPTEGDGGGADG